MEEKLLDFLMLVIANSHKCQHCIHCFHDDDGGSGCAMAYDCIARDFYEYDEGD